MGTPKRSPIQRSSIKGIGDLRRKNQFTPEAEKQMIKRTSRKIRKSK